LLEGMFSDEEMETFGDAASYSFQWIYNPHRNDAPPPAGTYQFHFKALNQGASGVIYLNIGSSSLDRHNRMDIRFSVNINVDSPGRAANHASTRLRGVVMLWKGMDDLKEKFEDWIRGPITVLLANKRMTKGTLTAATTKFLNGLMWKNNVTGLATPEEIAQLKQRFEYGEEKGPDSNRHSGMFDDPRVEGKETDYEYLTSEDVRFWNMMADEYDARRTQPT